ncbi:hypothetical protein [Haloarchaeobius sp. HME9146]|uniref:hypothetical protein n=1 Tax=Haloarchaeobius sp. HME9146 TaxID=2978732 RepID=UPI0021BFF954|nr:hypothetical protein [Haloarchaeobius sp. HME9146]MCT9097370.1 hypothetical protein [Haloarchaeobius sp. HME9146]
MSDLDDLQTDVSAAYDDLDDLGLDFDRETKMELAMLSTALGTGQPEDLLQRAVHMLFQSTVDTGKLDFHLRSEYDVTYDEYLSGMTFDEMTGQSAFPQQPQDDDRRYQF